MEVMVVDGEVDAKNESYDDDSVAEGRFETTLVETVKTHRDECDADEGPVVDYCSGPDEEGEEMVVGEHPDAHRRGKRTSLPETSLRNSCSPYTFRRKREAGATGGSRRRG